MQFKKRNVIFDVASLNKILGLLDGTIFGKFNIKPFFHYVKLCELSICYKCFKEAHVYIS